MHSSRGSRVPRTRESITERGVFNAGGGGFTSLDEAVLHVEKMLQGVRWVE